MLTLIRGGEVYAPDYLGRKDILVAFDRILAIGEDINSGGLPVPPVVIDAAGKMVVPGLIDQHVHIIGSGGEGGFATRTPEVSLSALVTAGVTTVVGVLGVDSVTRQMTTLLAKAKGLEVQGLTTFIYTGAYSMDASSLTGSTMSDVALIDKVVGIGELAVSDHRSPQMSTAEIARVASEARVGGLLGGKAGVLHLHIGEGRNGLSHILEIVRETEIPASQFVPTHMNRSIKLVEQGVIFTEMGGTIDLTAGVSAEEEQRGMLSVPWVLKYLQERNVSISRVTVSSDGNGSLPVFDQEANLFKMNVARVRVLWEDLRETVTKGVLPLDDALRLATENVARVLKLPTKGKLAPGRDADLLLLTPDLEIDTVMARGRVLLQKGQMVERT